jgi:hypothetical protein
MEGRVAVRLWLSVVASYIYFVCVPTPCPPFLSDLDLDLLDLEFVSIALVMHLSCFYLVSCIVFLFSIQKGSQNFNTCYIGLSVCHSGCLPLSSLPSKTGHELARFMFERMHPTRTNMRTKDKTRQNKTRHAKR